MTPHPKDSLYPNAIRTYSDLERYLGEVREVEHLANLDVRKSVADYLREPSQLTVDQVDDTISLYMDALADCDNAPLAWPTVHWLHCARMTLSFHWDGDKTLDVSLRRFSDGTA